jgi:MoaA/NifB/PqqE/SkfB family radical SAM enzyme
VNTTVFADNYDQFSELHSLVEKNFPLAGFTFETIRGHYDGDLCQPISDEMYGRLVDAARPLKRIRDSGQLELHELAVETVRQRTQVVPCIGGTNFIVLDFFGNLYPCEILPRVTNIRDIQYDFRRVLDDPTWTRAIQDIQNAKCHCTHMCFLSASLDEVKKQASKKNIGGLCL